MQSSDGSDLSPAHGAKSTRTADISNGVVPTVSVRMQRILLATDLSPASAVATDWAFALAGLEGAELLIVSVIDPHELWLENQRFAVRWDQVRDRRQAAAQELVARGRPKGLDITFLVWTGDPGESIVSVAEAEAVDLIVVGTHGRGSIGRLFLGSVSEHVVRHAPCPVLVARPGNAVRPRSV
jgi:nucleotide-binding universal stress UspA family protein